MKITVIPGRQLTPEHVQAWSALQATVPALSSPFLCPEFTVAVAAVRDDVRVGILEQGGRMVGFFPHQRRRWFVGEPVGGWLNDLQGVIAQPDAEWDAGALIRGCGLLEWRYGRLLASQEPFAPFHLRRHASAFIDVSRGYDAYLAEKRQSGVDLENVQQLARKTRNVEREIGPLRFESHSSDISVLAALMRWKSERYAPHGYRDAFAVSWARRLLERVHATQTLHFGGILSVLYAGDEVAAAHMGLRSESLWHFWFPAYNPRFARYSPGLMLLLRMAQHASAAGLQGIELGGGAYAFKQTLANRSVILAEGGVARLPAITAARRWRRSSATLIRQSPLLHLPARAVNRALHGVMRLCR